MGAERQIPEHVARNIERGRRALSGSPEMLRAIADEIQGWTWDSDRIVEQTEERLARIAEMVADLQEKQAILLRLADAMRPEPFEPPTSEARSGRARPTAYLVMAMQAISTRAPRYSPCVPKA